MDITVHFSKMATGENTKVPFACLIINNLNLSFSFSAKEVKDNFNKVKLKFLRHTDYGSKVYQVIGKLTA